MECKFTGGRNQRVAGEEELIDTLWNVNRNDKSGGSDRTRINRYIMECKLLLSIFPIFAASRINRYIMECKSVFSTEQGTC